MGDDEHNYGSWGGLSINLCDFDIDDLERNLSLLAEVIVYNRGIGKADGADKLQSLYNDLYPHYEFLRTRLTSEDRALIRAACNDNLR